MSSQISPRVRLTARLGSTLHIHEHESAGYARPALSTRVTSNATIVPALPPSLCPECYRSDKHMNHLLCQISRHLLEIHYAADCLG